MKRYGRIAVASAFTPTYAALLEEAKRVARRCSAQLDVIHASAFDAEKEASFREIVGPDVPIRWSEAETPATAIANVVKEFGYDLLIAGALHREDSDKPFTSGVARDLMKRVPCDLLLIPGASMEAHAIEHVIFAFEPGEDCASFLADAVNALSPRKVTIVAAETPFAAALAASRGEPAPDPRTWSEDVADGLRSRCAVEVDTWIVASNTGYAVLDAVQGIGADLFVVRGGSSGHPLPMHLDWLYSVIPTRLLVTKENRFAS